MDKMKYLEKCRDLAYHNLMCYSKTLSMTEPKEGYEKEWKQMQKECCIVEELIAEQKQKAIVGGVAVMVIDRHVVDCWERVEMAMDVLLNGGRRGKHAARE